MTTEIYVISGFLGAGKTTLIQKLLKEAFAKEKVILIENDFGEISVDAALLKSGSVEVKEINSGCICCSLSGDFVKALKEVLDRFHPDKIIIEPSGVGKLSDIVKSCSDPRIKALAEVKLKITVADVKRCKMYLENFGDFFEDQIKNADIILLSHTGHFPDKVSSAQKLIRSLNPHSAIVSKPWDQINMAEFFHPVYNYNLHTEPSHGSSLGYRKQDTYTNGNYGHTHHNSCEHTHHGDCDHSHHDNCDHSHHSNCEHKHHDNCEHTHHGNCGHSHHDNCGHSHSAEDVFDTVTIRTKQIFSTEDLKARVSAMEQNAGGTVLRAKGIVRSTTGYINLQYLPGDIQITKCAAVGDMLCIIGQNLNRRELCALFGGE
ncbi:MAG TPA: GTP-binding protein [Clostridiales bacterium]|nr:GTP-binding protein [Clostridiales bacterium]